MKTKGIISLLRSSLFAALLAPVAVADVSMQFVSAGSNGSLGGVAIGPYTIKMNGVATQMVCDDYTAHTYYNETWKAEVHTFSDLQGTKFYSTYTTAPVSQQRYFAAALLFQQLMNCGNNTCKGQYQFALWQALQPAGPTDPLSKISGANLSMAQTYLAKALDDAETADASLFADLRILTPIAGTALCGGQTCASSPPQEFIVRVPEASAIAMLAVNLFGLFGLITALRRRGWRLNI